MKWLGVDTSEKLLLVCLYDGDKPLYVNYYDAWQRQSEFLIAEMGKAFVSTKLRKREIEAVIVGKGPGSYTGVRIGLTVAKTVAFALKIPLYLVSSLELLQDFGRPCICLSNARGKRSYFAVYDKGVVIEKDCVKTNDEVQSYVRAHPEYKPCGDLSYLGLESSDYSADKVFLHCLDEGHRCENPFLASPVYLKDDYAISPTEMVVRKMIPIDIPEIVKIEEECFGHSYGVDYWDKSLTENPFAHTYSVIMDNQVVGFIDFLITFDSASVNLIAVKEKYRKKGVGNRLIGQLLKDCASDKREPVEFITLEVRASNANAIRFYTRHQFQQITVKKAYYDDGEDAIYMVRSVVND